MDTIKRCPARLAYRDMSDIGSHRTCGAPVKTTAGFCLRHDPETAPKRGKDGRILAKCPKHCATCKRDYDAYCKSQSHPVAKRTTRTCCNSPAKANVGHVGAPGIPGSCPVKYPQVVCPNHPDRPAASPSSNLCGPCLMGRPQ